MPYIANVLDINGLEPDLFIEPFAGGASVALELLATSRVKRIGLAERDPYVVAFWHTVFFDSDWLCKQVEQVELSLGTWNRMKTTRFRTMRGRALACLFLNRTSFNGALHCSAGPIGGQRQVGNYALGCRFPRRRLVRRIRTCASLASEGGVEFIREADAVDIIRHLRRRRTRNQVFLYLDPPFWSKAKRLYRFSFAEADHARLAKALHDVDFPYLLSYDPAPEIEDLYSGNGSIRKRVELLYTATQRTAEEELVITNLERLPRDCRLWRTNGEWRRVRRSRGRVRLSQ